LGLASHGGICHNCVADEQQLADQESRLHVGAVGKIPGGLRDN
jgi:hypothetical protein